MKKLFAFTLLLVLIFTMLPMGAFAAENKQSTTEIIYLEDGSYITIELVTIDSRASGTKSGSKTYRYKDGDGDELWNATLTGTFTYTGSSATCTASSVSTSIINDNWYIVSKSASKSGSTATGTATAGRKLLGVTIKKDTINMTLTCSASGTLS